MPGLRGKGEGGMSADGYSFFSGVMKCSEISDHN